MIESESEDDFEDETIEDLEIDSFDFDAAGARERSLTPTLLIPEAIHPFLRRGLSSESTRSLSPDPNPVLCMTLYSIRSTLLLGSR